MKQIHVLLVKKENLMKHYRDMNGFLEEITIPDFLLFVICVCNETG